MERNIVNFYELDPQWQEEAISNLGDCAEEASYLEPLEDANPEEHILWDLTEAMSNEGNHEGFQYNCSMGISNNSAMLIMADEEFETCKIKFV